MVSALAFMGCLLTKDSVNSIRKQGHHGPRPYRWRQRNGLKLGGRNLPYQLNRASWSSMVILGSLMAAIWGSMTGRSPGVRW